jgi:hypothetical protein
MDEPTLDDIRASMEAFDGRTARARWATAEAAFLALRARVLAKAPRPAAWEDEWRAYQLCYQLRNLAFQWYLNVLERYAPEDWDAATEICDLLVAHYAEELRQLRILCFRVYRTFAPDRHRLNRAQHRQLFRCFSAFDTGDPGMSVPGIRDDEARQP